MTRFLLFYRTLFKVLSVYRYLCAGIMVNGTIPANQQNTVESAFYPSLLCAGIFAIGS
jgi:hypothetical protein